jgi:hypothetical protein
MAVTPGSAIGRSIRCVSQLDANPVLGDGDGCYRELVVVQSRAVYRPPLIRD